MDLKETFDTLIGAIETGDPIAITLAALMLAGAGAALVWSRRRGAK